MAIELICQGCSRKLRVGEEHAGKQARCPECGTVMPVTAAAAMYSRGEAGPPGPAVSPSPSVNPFAPTPTPSHESPTVRSPAPAAPPFTPTPTRAPPPDASAARWMMRADNGQAYGPITRVELDAWVQQGRVSATALVAQEGAAQWQRAGEVYPQLNPIRPGGSDNPWSDRAAAGGVYAAPGGFSAAGVPFDPYARGGYKRAHRGVMVLVLGCLSWVICFLFGIFAFAMGQADLSAMRRGEMDDSGRGMTQAGTYLGLAHLIVMLGVIVFAVLSAVLEGG